MIRELDDANGIIMPALLSEMLERLGIDPEGAQTDSGFARASRRCLRCPKTQLCGHWVETAVVPKTAPLFCPNARFLRRVKHAG